MNWARHGKRCPSRPEFIPILASFSRPVPSAVIGNHKKHLVGRAKTAGAFLGCARLISTRSLRGASNKTPSWRRFSRQDIEGSQEGVCGADGNCDSRKKAQKPWVPELLIGSARSSPICVYRRHLRITLWSGWLGIGRKPRMARIGTSREGFIRRWHRLPPGQRDRRHTWRSFWAWAALFPRAEAAAGIFPRSRLADDQKPSPIFAVYPAVRVVTPMEGGLIAPGTAGILPALFRTSIVPI